MKIVIAGGTGWLGSAIGRTLAADGHEVVVLSRSGAKPAFGRTISWDGASQGPWIEEIDGADAVLNFTGESIAGKRWNGERKRELVRSRVEPTTALVTAIRAASSRPRVLVNASAVGYYGDRGDAPLTEEEPPGSDFLAHLVVGWEAAAKSAEAEGTRVVLFRMAPVMGPGGGALPRLALPFRLFVGGPVGSGRQWFPWVHLEDVVGVARRALQDDQLRGPINVAAGSVEQRDFAAALGQALGRPSWLPVPRFLLRIAVGEVADALVFSQRVVPGALRRQGYEFGEPELLPALRRALGRAS